MPHGLEEGSEVELPAQEFGLVVGEPTEFRFLSSATRRDDHVGTLLETWRATTSTSWRRWRRRSSGAATRAPTVPVHLQARVNEVGVLELWCVSRDEQQRWKLEFNVRAKSDVTRDSTVRG